MRKLPMLLIPTVLFLGACSEVAGPEVEDHARDINAVVTERCDPPRFEAYGQCQDRRGPKPE